MLRRRTIPPPPRTALRPDPKWAPPNPVADERTMTMRATMLGLTLHYGVDTLVIPWRELLSAPLDDWPGIIRGAQYELRWAARSGLQSVPSDR